MEKLTIDNFKAMMNNALKNIKERESKLFELTKENQSLQNS